MSQALVIIRPLILRMDPFKKVIWQWSNLLVMLSFGLAFIGVPSVTVWLLKFGRDIGPQVPIAAGIFAVSLEASPATIRLLLPNVHGLQSQLVQEAELDDMLSRAAQPLEQMMNNALHFLMTDLPSFVRFVECESNCAQLQEKTLNKFSWPILWSWGDFVAREDRWTRLRSQDVHDLGRTDRQWMAGEPGYTGILR